MHVIASGAFDLLHYGHLLFLEEARRLGEPDPKLTVIVASDETVTRTKGRPPVMPGYQRLALVEALKVVDDAYIGEPNLNMEKIIKQLKPDIVAVGHDQKEIEDQLMELVAEKGYTLRVVRVGKFGTEDLNSSSKIRKRIVEESGKRA